MHEGASSKRGRRNHQADVLLIAIGKTLARTREAFSEETRATGQRQGDVRGREGRGRAGEDLALLDKVDRFLGFCHEINCCSLNIWLCTK